MLRLLFILAGGILGPLGIILLFAVMLFNICGMDSFGVPYTSPITPSGKGFWQDGILRASWRTLSKNQFSVKKLPGVQNKNDLQ